MRAAREECGVFCGVRWTMTIGYSLELVLCLHLCTLQSQLPLIRCQSDANSLHVLTFAVAESYAGLDLKFTVSVRQVYRGVTAFGYSYSNRACLNALVLKHTQQQEAKPRHPCWLHTAT